MAADGGIQLAQRHVMVGQRFRRESAGSQGLLIDRRELLEGAEFGREAAEGGRNDARHDAFLLEKSGAAGSVASKSHGHFTQQTDSLA